MRKVIFTTLIALLLRVAANAQGDGLGGVLIRDVPIPTDEEEWPTVLPAGGLVAFGTGNDWSATRRENGKIQVHFLILEEDGGHDGGHAWIPEDSVQTFTWACGEPIERRMNPRRPIICSPFVTTGLFVSSSQWTLKFVTEARKLAQDLGLKLVEEFSPAYKGGSPSPPSTGTGSAPVPSAASRCTVDQILKMKEAGLSDAQIKAACDG
jgi:hypothetical protein